MIRYQNVLREYEKKHILEQAMVLLNKTGFITNQPECLELFKQAGCKFGKKVDKPKEGQIVYLTEEICMDALDKAKGDFTLYPMYPGYKELKLLSGEQYFATAGGDYVWDITTDKLRSGKLQDLVMGMRLLDEIDNYDLIEWPVYWFYDVFPSDNYEKYRAFGLTMGVMMLHSGKPQMPVWWSASDEEVPDYIKFWQMAAGGKEEFRKKPNGGICIGFDSPLALCGKVHPDDPWNHGDSIAPMAEAGVPAAIVPCSLMGLTAPCTVAGLLTVDIAEILACNVLLQTANPGHPVYINWMSGAVDMMTGAKTQSSPADVLRNLAMVDMGHYMGMAVLGFMASSANATDAQCGWETMANLQSQYIYGMDLMAHVACLSAEDIYDPRSAVIGDEMINWVKLFKKGFDVSDEAMAIDEVIKYGPAGINGDFLKSKHTRKYYQKTLMKSTPLANHLNRDGWVSAGKMDLRDRAAELVKEKVTQNKPKIPESLEKEIRAYISEILDRENIKGDEAKEIIDKTYWQGF